MLKLQKESEEKSEFGGKSSNGQSPDISIRNSIKSHDKKMRFFEWAKSHFEAETLYRVDFSDLTLWEIAPDRY